MNKLYSILVYGAPYSETYDWYRKERSAFMPTQRMLEVKNIMLQDVPPEAIPLFAATICYLVRFTALAEQIKELDPNNTYSAPVRPPNTANSNQAYCLHQWIKPASAYATIRQYLDDETEAKINLKAWLDLMAAGCLVMLRELA